MNGRGKTKSPDALLLEERARRMRRTLDAREPHVDAEVLMEGDAIVDAPPHAVAPTSDCLHLYRPLALVSLAGLAWTGAVDHDALQSAIVCAPLGGEKSADAPQWLRAVGDVALGDAPPDEPSLHVSLGSDEIALVSRLAMRVDGSITLGVARAAALPDSIAGTDSITGDAAKGAFVAYRRAALVHAWQGALLGASSNEVARERDAAAIELISTLRAVLGES